MVFRTHRILLAGISLGLLALAGCDASSSKPFLPPVGFKGDVAMGNELFRQYCSGCHGRDVRGTDGGPPLIHDIYKPGHHSDLSFFMAVDKGATAHHWKFGNMPKIPGPTAEDVAHIVAYVRSEQRKAGIR